jgi:PAS domain S-box-containing protein
MVDGLSLSPQPLPCLIADAISTLQWPLDRSSANRQMKLLPLHDLNTPVFPSCGEIHALELVFLLASQASRVIEESPAKKEQWATIAAAILLLGHGYADHAHDLIGPLSFQNDLPYFHGPAIIVDSDILAAASLVHALVHRREGPHPSEFGATGYSNSDFWASAALRSGGEETLPLSMIRSRVEDLASIAGVTAQQWFQRNYSNTVMIEEWDPRPMTALCREVVPVTTNGPTVPQKHGLLEFAQKAALTELHVLLEHSLTRLGYQRIHESTQLTQGMRLLVADQGGRLPKSLEEASSQSFQLDAVVVTTATHPHQIVYVNDAWVAMCGYTPELAIGKTFSMLLHGEESNAAVARLAAKQCAETQLPHEVYVVNYTASGERFINHVIMGPMYHPHYSGHEERPSYHQSQDPLSSSGCGLSAAMTQSNTSRLEYMVAILKKVEHRSSTANAA